MANTPTVLMAIEVGDQVAATFKDQNTYAELASLVVQLDYADADSLKRPNLLQGTVEAIGDKTISNKSEGVTVDVEVPEGLTIQRQTRVEPATILRRMNQVWITRQGSPPIATAVYRQ